MAEEHSPGRGCAEGTWISLTDSPAWELFTPEEGDVVEFSTSLVTGHLGTAGIAALLVTHVARAEEGSLVLGGRVVGCDNEEVGKTLSTYINRRHMSVHVCWHAPCTHGGSEEMVHVTRLRWWPRSVFEAPYMKAWGKLVLKEYAQEAGEEFDGDEPEERPGRHRKPALKRPAGKVPKPEGRRKKPARGKDAGRPGGDPDALREKLRRLKEKVDGGGEKERRAPTEVLDSSEAESLADSGEEESEKVPEPGKRRAQTRLAIMDIKREIPEKAPEKGKKKRRKVKTVKEVKDPNLQLLAQAEHARDTRMEEQKQKKAKKSKSSGLGKVRALVAAITGVKGTQKQKKGRAGKRASKKMRDGGDPGSSDGSTAESEKDAEDSDSSSTEMLAPLQKKSARRPGAVLRMLIQHAKHSLDQSALVEARQTEDITGGIKMSTYFNLLVRPYYSVGSRDLKELNLLAICLDELRAGELGKLGDSLASRFLAVHTALGEGSWRAAQYLELHPLEPTSGAPAALLLEARRHGKLVSKSQGEDWRRPRAEGDSWKGSKGGDQKGKGKGAGKDWNRKGKGKQDWSGGGNWNRGGKDWWASQKDRGDGKEKPGEKDAKKGDK